MRLSAISVVVAGLLCSGCAVEVFGPDDVASPDPAATGEPSQAAAPGTVVPVANEPGLVDPAIRPALAPGDRTRMMEAAEVAFTSGDTTQWVNESTGNHGRMRPGESYDSSGGAKCRNFTHSVWVGGSEDVTTGTACQDAGGDWRITG